MSLKTKLKDIEAKLDIKVYDKEGKLIPEKCMDACVFTIIGKQEIGDLLREQGGAVGITHCALGDDGTEAQKSDEHLGNELYREAIDSHSRTGTIVKITVVIDYGEANGPGSQVYREAALLNAAVGGIMSVRANFPDKTKTSSVRWTLEWQILV